MNQGNKTGSWKIDLEANTVVLVTNEGLTQGGAGEKDEKSGLQRWSPRQGLGQACSEWILPQPTVAGWLQREGRTLRESGPLRFTNGLPCASPPKTRCVSVKTLPRDRAKERR